MRATGLATFAGDRILDAWFPAGQVELRDHGRRRVIEVEIDPEAPPKDVPDAYLRLHLLSWTQAKPHAVNLDGIFGVLPNNAWTDEGPFDPADLETERAQRTLDVRGLDKFPRLTDYAPPPG